MSAPSTYGTAVADFRQARQQAALQSLVARLTGKSVDLLSYDDVVHKLRPTGQAERGLREIPLQAIVGSVGRYTDFTRTFLPRHGSDQQRWAQVKAVIDQRDLDALPPIEVYQIGDAYFVRDGNHRVSIARQLGFESIHAFVTEVQTRVPIAPDVQPDDLIIKAEYAAFLEYTRLDELCPGCDLAVSAPGQYAKLEDHIEAHRYLKEAESGREMPFPDAACSWYNEAYLPVVQAIREQGILRYSPKRTEADLYLWLSDHRVALQRELGWHINPEAAAAKLAALIGRQPGPQVRHTLNTLHINLRHQRHATGQWRIERLADRYEDRLFADVLVALSGQPESWAALDQALVVAQRDGAHVHGLHVADEASKRGDGARALGDAFKRRCEAGGIRGELGVESGAITPRIVERSVMADLVVLHLAHPPAPGPLARLGSKVRAIIEACPRPVLFVQEAATPLARALLAYDGSSRAREALFVAAYLAEQWRTSLVVLTVQENGPIAPDALDFARRYLEVHETQAEFVHEHGRAAEAILQSAARHDADLLLMGGYGAKSIWQAMIGNTVEDVLRESRLPVLVCR